MVSDNEEITFTINKQFADKYDSSKRGQEISAIRDKYGPMDESRLALIAQRQHKYGYTKNADYDYDSYDSEDDEEEDEVGELITPEVDGQIMKTIGLIRAQDPKIYEATSHFFIPSEMEKARKQWKEKQAEEKKNKPMNLQDYHRKVLMEDGGIVDEEEEDKKIKDESEMTHVEQQEYLKREMKNAFMAGDDDDEGNEDADSFFTQKAKTKEDEEAEEEDYKRFLMESMGSKKGGAEAFQDWREYKNGPKMDKDEAFLMDYILNRGWIDKSQKKTPHYKEIVREEDFDELEKSEDELDAAEEFESKYNFRFEEAEGNSLTGYTRTIDDSVRNKDDKRKRQRTAAKERKKEEKTRQLEDLKRAKNVKKQEIFNKLKQIQEITGNKTVGFDEIDLETDFNPEDYDQKMESMFSDKYYDGDENEKPVFDDDIDTADYEAEDDNDNGSSSAEGGDGDDDEEQAETNVEDEAYPPEYDDGEGGYEEGYYDENGGYDEYGYGEGGDEEDVMMDADYLPGGENYGKPAKKETKKERAQREKEEKKQAKLALSQGGNSAAVRTAVAAIEASRSMLDADKKKDFNSYLDEYYQLDYEDMVGDLPTRFKYHKVKSSAFGLTPVEILLADDKDLNEFVSLKKFAPYRRTDEQEADIQKYSKKNRVQMFRHKLKSQIKDQELDKDWDPVKRRKKELEKREREEKAALEAKEEEEGDGEEKKKSKKKNKEKKRKAEAEEKVSSSKDSLEEEGERKKKKKGDSEDGNDDSKKKTKSKKKEDK
ncbi:KRRI-Interacting protein 1 [Dissophora ornata]|nr:KRRI-Interacting protein 1 [Dissophora ornata]